MSALTTPAFDLGQYDTDAAYLDAGYHLPAGWDWPTVAAFRHALGIDSRHVPLAEKRAGCCAWGVPFQLEVLP